MINTHGNGMSNLAKVEMPIRYDHKWTILAALFSIYPILMIVVYLLNFPLKMESFAANLFGIVILLTYLGMLYNDNKTRRKMKIGSILEKSVTEKTWLLQNALYTYIPLIEISIIVLLCAITFYIYSFDYMIGALMLLSVVYLSSLAFNYFFANARGQNYDSFLSGGSIIGVRAFSKLSKTAFDKKHNVSGLDNLRKAIGCAKQLLNYTGLTSEDISLVDAYLERCQSEYRIEDLEAMKAFSEKISEIASIADVQNEVEHYLKNIKWPQNLKIMPPPQKSRFDSYLFFFTVASGLTAILEFIIPIFFSRMSLANYTVLYSFLEFIVILIVFVLVAVPTYRIVRNIVSIADLRYIKEFN